MSVTNEEALTALRRRAEAAQQSYMQTLGQIKAQKTQLDQAMAALHDFGCESVAEAEQLAESLQADIDARLIEVRRQLG